MKQFHIGDILSVTTGKLVSPRLIEGVYDVLNYMTGESLFTHQLPRVGREAAPVLLRQHPQLADCDASGVNADNWRVAGSADCPIRRDVAGRADDGRRTRADRSNVGTR